MSLVDYAAAARKRVPAWQGVEWQPGLWLAWGGDYSRSFCRRGARPVNPLQPD